MNQTNEFLQWIILILLLWFAAVHVVIPGFHDANRDECIVGGEFVTTNFERIIPPCEFEGALE